MERIQRALDLARTQRDALAESPARARPVTRGREKAAIPPDFIDLAPPPDPLPELATPQRFPLDTAALRERRVVFPEDQTPAGHAFRMLRTQLRQLVRDQQHRIIGVVSATAGEGKTLTAINLALALAADPDLAVMLVELDLRHPSIADVLGLRSEHGLDAYIAGLASLAQVDCALEGIERLIVLPARTPVANSSIALAGPRIQDLLRNLRSAPAGQIAIVDLPPVLLSDDVLTIAPALDGVVMVGREGHTKREDLQRMKEMLGGVRILGSVLNQASESETRGY